MGGLNSSKTIPDRWRLVLTNHFKMFPPDTEDFTQPVLRPSMREVLPLFIILYGLLILVGLVANVTMALNIIRKKNYVNPICTFLLNIAICNIIMSVLVLPLSLAMLLIQNWVFGKALCYIAPMLQDIPVHASTASLVAIAMERFRSVVMTTKRRFPSIIVVVFIWVVAISVVLPHCAYMDYLDTETYFGEQLSGVGVCAVSLSDNIAAYIRGLFIALYASPLILISYLHIMVGAEIRKREEPSNNMVMEQRPQVGSMTSRGSRVSRGSRSSQGDVWTPQDETTGTISTLLVEPDCRGDIRRHSSFLTPHDSNPNNEGERGRSSSLRPPFSEEPPPDEVDLQKEKRDQRYVAYLFMCYALCLCPLMILRIVKNMVVETHANSAHFDLTFITFVWVAFLPTLTTPTIFAFWRINRVRKPSLIHRPLNACDRRYPITTLSPPEGSRRCSLNPYGHDFPPHSPHVGIRGHRLSVESSLSVNTHILVQGHAMGRPVTPTSFRGIPMGSPLPQKSLGPPEGFTRPHSLSFSS